MWKSQGYGEQALPLTGPGMNALLLTGNCGKKAALTFQGRFAPPQYTLGIDVPIPHHRRVTHQGNTLDLNLL